MPKASPAEGKAKYAIEAQAANLFAFLRQTFSQMPRSVQVVGWLVMLLLFVFLVLHPIIGITYFSGKVVTFKRDKEGHTIMATERGLRIHKGITTYTNDEGEFTVAVRVPNIPMLAAEFDLGSGEGKEIVSLPGPLPFVSMFNPNTRKIYYVPGSNLTDIFGVAKRFFLDPDEARKALGAGHGEKSEGPRDGHSAISSFVLEQLRNSGVAHAAEQQFREPMYTLRLRELKLSGISSSAKEIYFDILVDGASVQVRDFPHAGSRKADYLTVFGGVPLRLQDMDIPLLKPFHRVDIAVRSSGLIKDQTLGSAVWQLRPDDVGKTFTQTGKNLELMLEFMPPVAFKYSSWIREDKRFLSALWLDVPPEYLKSVAAVRYIFPDGSVGSFPIVNVQSHFQYISSLWQPEKVIAEITFVSGSAIRLTNYVEPKLGEMKSPLDFFMQASLSFLGGDYQQALQFVDKALLGAPSFAEGYSLKASILTEMHRYGEAIELYERAVAMDPNNAIALNSYAYFVAERLPQPTATQLLKARERAKQAVHIVPEPNYYDTLGWVHFKLREYPQALEALTRAKELQIDRTGTVYQEIQYHLAYVYLRMERKAEAKASFRDVLAYTQKNGYVTKEVGLLDADAKKQLERLK